jgi:hypothetical protein
MQVRLPRLRTAGLLAATALAAGCATVNEPLQSNLRLAPARECAAWFQKLDGAVERAGVRDAGAHRIAGFPYLRADRFLASFRDQAATNEAAFADWVNRLVDLDRSAREAEVANLPARSLAELPATNVPAALARTEQCAAALRAIDLSDTGRRALLRARAKVPDDYSTTKRTLGLYALTRIPFYRGVENWQEDARAAFSREVRGPVLRYAPDGPPVSAEQVAQIVSNMGRDALGAPLLSAEEREILWRAFAPVFEIETAGDYDRFGPLSWVAGPSPAVDVSRPTAYRRLAFTRVEGRVHLQLVYTIWFPERPRAGSLDLLGGRLDGLVWRVTLDQRGRALVYDTIHPCGCYHMFFPTERVRPRPAPERGIEWAFVPLTLPLLEPAAPVAVLLATGTHYVVGVRAAAAEEPTSRAGEIRHYSFAEEADLRTLARADGGTRGAFDSNGIVPGTERGERWLFWPMGIADPGAMRQWGTHATAFVGRRHFDDADLIERRFAVLP